MNSWIFQGNPKYFRLDDYLRENKEIYWTVFQHMNEMSSGDVVYIWRSNGGKSGTGGIVAKGKLIECPYEMPDYVLKYWIKKPEGYLRGARIVIEDVRLDKNKSMLKRDDLKKDNVFKDLKIIPMAMETNYKLETKHSEHIDQLWNQKKMK